MIIENRTPPVIKGNLFSRSSATVNIYVPEVSVTKYAAANIWSTYKSNVYAKEDLEG